jgi:hypothetical protein
MSDESDLITLDEAAKLIPGADADTLKRMHRSGKLVCYRPGKKLLTTRANVMEAVTNQCSVTPKRPELQKLPDMDMASAAFDLALSRLPTRKKK